MQNACAVLLSVACRALQYFFTLSHKGCNLKKKVIENTGGAKKCIHILRYVICLLLFEVELNYGSNV